MNPEQGPKPDPMAHLSALGGANKYAVEKSGRFSENPLPKEEADQARESGYEEKTIEKSQEELLPKNFDLENLNRVQTAIQGAIKSEPESDNRKFLMNLADRLLKDYGMLDSHENLTESNLDSVAKQVNSYFDLGER